MCKSAATNQVYIGQYLRQLDIMAVPDGTAVAQTAALVENCDLIIKDASTVLPPSLLSETEKARLHRPMYADVFGSLSDQAETEKKIAKEVRKEGLAWVTANAPQLRAVICYYVSLCHSPFPCVG
jgi:hypothetical protein